MSELTQDQTETLQEIVNIGMGQAGASLARILDVFIELSVPRISLVDVADIVTAVCDLLGNCDNVYAIRQAFRNNDNLSGEAIIIFGEAGCNDLAGMMGYDSNEPVTESELMLDVGNVLTGASLNGIAEQLDTSLSFSAPSIMGEHAPLSAIMDPEMLSWKQALLMEVNFGMENSDFKSHLLILMTEESIDRLGESLDHFLENM